MFHTSSKVEGVSEALLDTYKAILVHAPGRVLTDLAVAVADGADAISGIEVLTDRPGPDTHRVRLSAPLAPTTQGTRNPPTRRDSRALSMPDLYS